MKFRFILIAYITLNLPLISQCQVYQQALADFNIEEHAPSFWKIAGTTVGRVVLTDGTNKTDFPIRLLKDNYELNRIIIQVADSHFVGLTFHKSMDSVEAVILELYEGEVNELDYGNGPVEKITTPEAYLEMLTMKNGHKIVLNDNGRAHMLMLPGKDYFIFPSY